MLVVEDSVKTASLLKRGLEEEGYAVDVASTGEEAVWMATENPNDGIVLDVTANLATSVRVSRTTSCQVPVLEPQRRSPARSDMRRAKARFPDPTRRSGGRDGQDAVARPDPQVPSSDHRL